MLKRSCGESVVLSGANTAKSAVAGEDWSSPATLHNKYKNFSSFDVLLSDTPHDIPSELVDFLKPPILPDVDTNDHAHDDNFPNDQTSVAPCQACVEL